jgi:hypothetical protein
MNFARCCRARKRTISPDRAMLLSEFLAKEKPHLALRALPGTAHVHGHCHQKSFGAFPDALTALKRVPELTVKPIASSCCGMAGSFGYQAETQDVSRAMAEAGLLPAVRAAGIEDFIVADGTSCRHQIRDLSGGRRSIRCACWIGPWRDVVLRTGVSHVMAGVSHVMADVSHVMADVSHVMPMSVRHRCQSNGRPPSRPSIAAQYRDRFQVVEIDRGVNHAPVGVHDVNTIRNTGFLVRRRSVRASKTMVRKGPGIRRDVRRFTGAIRHARAGRLRLTGL